MRVILHIFLYFSFYFFLNAQTGTVALKLADGTLVNTYSSLQEAYNAIPSSVTTGYIIEFLPGYNASSEVFPITLTEKSGVDESKRIVIRPASNNTLVEIIGNVANPIITLDNADYLTFDGRPGGTGNQSVMKIENLYSGSGAHTIRLINGAIHNVFQYLHVKGASINTAGPRNFDFSTSANNPTGNSNNIIQYCKIEGSRSGIGFAGTSSYPNSDNIIANCEIFNFGYAGIWFSSNVRGALVENCTIYQTQGSNSTIVSGIISGTSITGDIIIRKNKIYGLQTAAAGGSSIRGLYFTPAANSNIIIENNFISLTSNNTSITAFYGINFIGSNQFQASVYYNTIYIGGLQLGGGTAGNVVSAGISFANTNAQSVFTSKNNICVNTRTSTYGVLHLANLISNTSAQLNIDYNVYYVPAQDYSYHAGWGTSYFNNLVDYQTAAAPNEAATKFRQVYFVSETDLHLTGVSIGDTNLYGIPIPGITTDIDGDLRSATSPYRGADEPLVLTPIGWCNLQWPPSGTINQGDSLRVYAQIWIDGITPSPGPGSGISAWIGVNNENTDPSTWTKWYPAVFNVDVGNNDEYMADIGYDLLPGTYYYASKFQFGSEVRYGGYSQSGGGFWDGTNYVSGVLTVQASYVSVEVIVDSLWNIVSVPGTPQQTNEDSLFYGNVSNAYWYNGSSYQIENDLNRGKGYWLKFSQPNSYSIPVTISNQLQINLIEGWNLIGTIHHNVPVSSVVTNPPNILASPFYGYHRAYYQTQTLEKGKGYWIKSNQPGTLILSLPFSAGKFNYKEEIDSKWPSLIFRNSESAREIFFTEEFDYSKFELPPIPPANSFDVRFYNNKYVADLNSDLINVLIQSPDDEVVVEAKNASFKILHDITSEKEIFLNQGEKIKLKLDKSGSIAVKPLTEIKSYSLSQNYPNPFNSQTQIRITLPENQFVELKLYNVMGEEIKTLISEFKNKGIYSVKLNLNDLASGVYIYKLSAGNFVDSKKLVLIK